MDYILRGSTDELIKKMKKLAAIRMGKPDCDHRFINWGYLVKGVEFQYLGVKEGYNYPPYMFNERMVGTVLTGTTSISGSALFFIKDYGTTDMPSDSYYQFKVTKKGIEQFKKNCFGRVNIDHIKLEGTSIEI